jgi:hypothetical protein
MVNNSICQMVNPLDIFELNRNTCGATFRPPIYPIFGYFAGHRVVTSSQGSDSYIMITHLLHPRITLLINSL